MKPENKQTLMHVGLDFIIITSIAIVVFEVLKIISQSICSISG